MRDFGGPLTVSLFALDENPFEVTERATRAYDAGNYAEAAALYTKVAEMLPRSGSAKGEYRSSTTTTTPEV